MEAECNLTDFTNDIFYDRSSVDGEGRRMLRVLQEGENLTITYDQQMAAFTGFGSDLAARVGFKVRACVRVFVCVCVWDG